MVVVDNSQFPDLECNQQDKASMLEQFIRGFQQSSRTSQEFDAFSEAKANIQRISKLPLSKLMEKLQEPALPEYLRQACLISMCDKKGDNARAKMRSSTSYYEAGDYLRDALAVSIQAAIAGETVWVINEKYDALLQQFFLGKGSGSHDTSLARYFITRLMYAVKADDVASLKQDESFLNLLVSCASFDESILAIVHLYFLVLFQDATLVKALMDDELKHFDVVTALYAYLPAFIWDNTLLAEVSIYLAKAYLQRAGADVFLLEDNQKLPVVLASLPRNGAGIKLKNALLDKLTYSLEHDESFTSLLSAPVVFSQDGLVGADLGRQNEIAAVLEKLLQTDDDWCMEVSSEAISAFILCDDVASSVKNQFLTQLIVYLDTLENVSQEYRLIPILLAAVQCDKVNIELKESVAEVFDNFLMQ